MGKSKVNYQNLNSIKATKNELNITLYDECSLKITQKLIRKGQNTLLFDL
jgi:hypothetical protein